MTDTLTRDAAHWLTMAAQGAVTMVVEGEGEETFALPLQCPPIEGEFVGGYNGKMRVAKAIDILKHVMTLDAEADAR